MKSLKETIGLIALFIAGLLVLNGRPASASSQESSGILAQGQALFAEHCDQCHGKDGRAKTVRGKLVGARNLADPSFQSSATDERIAGAIKKGPGKMPSFADKLSQSEIEALVSYVRQFKADNEK